MKAKLAINKPIIVLRNIAMNVNLKATLKRESAGILISVMVTFCMSFFDLA